MYDMLPPNDHPSAPSRANSSALECRSRRPDIKPTDSAARAPGIMAPYSWPKLPRMPQPSDSYSAVAR
jgi:hypothetical protein